MSVAAEVLPMPVPIPVAAPSPAWDVVGWEPSRGSAIGTVGAEWPAPSGADFSVHFFRLVLRRRGGDGRCARGVIAHGPHASRSECIAAAERFYRAGRFELREELGHLAELNR